MGSPMGITLQTANDEEALIPGTEIVPFPAEGSSPALPSRYEQQKMRDWRTFLHYLKNYDPPLSLGTCFDDGAFVIEYLRHFDQFGKTKVHLSQCAHFGHPYSPAPPCDCPVKQAWGSQDSLIGRLRAAYEENGGSSESNPFGAKAVREYLREVKEDQAKSRGVEYGKKKRNRPMETSAFISTPTGLMQLLDPSSGITSASTLMAEIAPVVDGNSGSVSDAGVVSTSMVRIPQVVDLNSGAGVASIHEFTSTVGVAQVADASRGSVRGAGDGSTSMAGITQVVGGSSVSASGGSTLMAAIAQLADGRSLSMAGIAHMADAISSGGVGASASHSSGVVTVELSMKSRFNTETPVEVNLCDKQYHGAWFPATVLKEINHDLFLVGYNRRFSDEEWCSKAFVDAQHIRPSPPQNLEGKEFVVSEKVDAYYECGWWSGKITEVLSDNWYVVHFEHQKIGREFSQFELRSHMEWINGEWVSDSWGVDPEHNQVGRTDQSQSSFIFHTIDIADGSKTGTQKIKLSTSVSNSKSSLPCSKLRKGEVSESSFPENEIPTSTIPSPSEELSDHSPPNFGQEKCGGFFNRDEEIPESSSILVTHAEKVIPTSILPCPSEELSDHPAPESFLFLITHPEEGKPTSTTPKPPNGLSDHPAANGQEKIGSIFFCHRSGSHIVSDDYNSSPLSNTGGEQCDSSKTQVQQLQNDIGDHSLPHSMNGTDQQQCRRVGSRRGGTGWRCPEMASPGKQHCEKHLLEQMIRNEKRRKKPGEQTRFVLEPFVPPTAPAVQQPCRRNGTGWRCHEMSLPGKLYCEKHQLWREMFNEKRRKRPIEQNRFIGPLLPINYQLCRRTGTGWRCHELALPGKRYCEKHQPLRDIFNEKRRKRPREGSGLVASDEKRKSNGNHLLPTDHQQCSGEGTGPTRANEGDVIHTDQGHLSQVGKTAKMKQKKGRVGKQNRINLEIKDQSEEMVAEASADGRNEYVNKEDTKESSGEQGEEEEIVEDLNCPLTYRSRRAQNQGDLKTKGSL